MARRRRSRRFGATAAALFVGVLLAGCGDETGAGTPGSQSTVANVGQLPVDFAGQVAVTGPGAAASADVLPQDADSVATTAPPATDGTTSPDVTEDTMPDDTTADDTTANDETATSRPTRQTPLGDDAEGNRLLVVGDSITESLLPSYGGVLCSRLEDRGWYVGADAVNGRDVDQGLDALERRLDDGDWDAAVINLGTNYRGDVDAYDATIRRILRRLGDVPVLVVTVTEWRDDLAEANYVIRSLADDRANVRVVDWADRTATSSALTGDDGIHLSDTGRAVLTNLLVRAVGDAPDDGDTGCRQYGGGSGSGSGSDDDGGD